MWCFVDIHICTTGDAGRHSDGGVLANSDFGQRLERNEMHIPSDQPLPGIFDY